MTDRDTDPRAAPTAAPTAAPGTASRTGSEADPGTARPPARRALPDAATLAARKREIAAFGRFLDSAIRLPGGYRIGWDGIIGLVPGVGDVVGMGLSGWLVWRAAELGVSRGTLARMIGNVALEGVIGAVPVIGDAFDFVFKANNRNVALLLAELERREGELGAGDDAAALRDGSIGDGFKL